VRYDTAKAPVHVDLRDGTATGQGRDTLVGIRHVVGSLHADFIAGNDQEGGQGDDLEGNGGADLILGRGGGDVIFDGRLKAGIHRSGGADVLRGGAGHDSLHFAEGDDRVFGGGSSDGFFVHAGGDDFVSGGNGADYMSFYDVGEPAVGPVEANLVTGLATTPGGTITFSSISSLQGSGFNDTLIGDTRNNRLDGVAGNDTLGGRGGDDRLFGWEGDDDLNGGSGVNTSDGGPDTDTCVNPDTAGGAQNCESP
jgi:Ca2+-binding RTX toxin-like protein